MGGVKYDPLDSPAALAWLAGCSERTMSPSAGGDNSIDLSAHVTSARLPSETGGGGVMPSVVLRPKSVSEFRPSSYVVTAGSASLSLSSVLSRAKTSICFNFTERVLRKDSASCVSLAASPKLLPRVRPCSRLLDDWTGAASFKPNKDSLESSPFILWVRSPRSARSSNSLFLSCSSIRATFIRFLKTRNWASVRSSTTAESAMGTLILRSEF